MFGWVGGGSGGGMKREAAANEAEQQLINKLAGAAKQSVRRTQEECSRLAADFKDVILCKP